MTSSERSNSGVYEPLAEELVPIWRAFCVGYERGFRDRGVDESNWAPSRELRRDFERLLAESWGL